MRRKSLFNDPTEDNTPDQLSALYERRDDLNRDIARYRRLEGEIDDLEREADDEATKSKFETASEACAIRAEDLEENLKEIENLINTWNEYE